MKPALLFLMGTVIATTVSAATPFTSDSTGTDWQAASFAYRVQWCEEKAQVLQRTAPGITGDYLIRGITAYYGSPDHPNVANLPTRVFEVAAFVATYYVKEKETP